MTNAAGLSSGSPVYNKPLLTDELLCLQCAVT